MRNIRKNKRNKRIRLIILLFVLCIFGVVIRGVVNHTTHTKNDSSPTPKKTTIVTIPTPTRIIIEEKNNSEGLQTAVENSLIGTNGSYGIVIKNLKTSEYYASNENTSYLSGSLYKLWVMATVYAQIEDGKLHENTIMEQDVVKLNKMFGLTPDSDEQTTGKIKMTINDALNQMITISSNNAALLLVSKITVSPIATFLNQNGLYESTVGVNGSLPTTTPSDIELFFEKLYQGKLNNQKFSNKMIALLKQQKLNDKIPKYLPDNLIIAHKTGELDEYSHDAGIIFSPAGDYIIVILSKSDNQTLAEERISLVSKSAYSYFNN